MFFSALSNNYNIIQNNLIHTNTAFVSISRSNLGHQFVFKQKNKHNAKDQENFLSTLPTKYYETAKKQRLYYPMSKKREHYTEENNESDHVLESLMDLSPVDTEDLTSLNGSNRIDQEQISAQEGSENNPKFLWSGHIVARVLPRAFDKYEFQKPSSQACSDDEMKALLYTYRHSNEEIMEKRDQHQHDKDSFIWICQDFVNADLSELFVTMDLDFSFTPIHVNRRTGDSSMSNGPSKASNPQDEAINVTIHMNRDADESAPRTLQRLEISTGKKLQSIVKHIQINQRHHRRQQRMQQRNENLKPQINTQPTLAANTTKNQFTQHIHKSSSFFFMFNSLDDSVAQNDFSRNIDPNPTDDILDISNLKNIDVWNKISTISHSDQSKKVGISLSCLNNVNKLSSMSEEGSSVPTFINMEIVSCPPTILAVNTFEYFKAQVFVGVPIVVELKLIFATHATITWFADGKELIRDSTQYTPTQNDIGKELSILIVPFNQYHDGTGCEEAYHFMHRVQPLPFMPILNSIRGQWIQQKNHKKDVLRVLTYNILADIYTARDIDEQIIHRHCNPQHLTRFRRMPMLVAEILAYNADIICLQEVDYFIFENLLYPVFKAKGYQGFYSAKVSAQPEGCAMFWSLDCFEKAKDEDMLTFSIRDIIYDEKSSEKKNNAHKYPKRQSDTDNVSSKRTTAVQWEESMKSIHALLDEHDELRKVACEKVGQVLQAATLTVKNKKENGSSRSHSNHKTKKPVQLILANTHLFYHPMASHVRAIQAFAICKKLDEIRNQSGSSSPMSHHKPLIPLVLCGDLNSHPRSGAIHLLFNRRLPGHHDCWKYLNEYFWDIGNTEDEIKNEIMHSESENKNQSELEGMMDHDCRDEYKLGEVKFDDFSQHNNNLSFSPPSIILPKCFPNLISGCSNIPKFTNYVSGFVETLDYILVSEPSNHERLGFQPISSAPMPSEDEVKPFIAMPNEFMPSDHVSVICDLQLKKY